MSNSPSPLARLLFGALRGVLVVASLLAAFTVGAVVIVPLTIFAPPAILILAGLLVLYVLAATSSLASDWQARRERRRPQRLLAARGESDRSTSALTPTPPIGVESVPPVNLGGRRL